jgi:hypothetical protein
LWCFDNAFEGALLTRTELCGIFAYAITVQDQEGRPIAGFNAVTYEYIFTLHDDTFWHHQLELDVIETWGAEGNQGGLFLFIPPPIRCDNVLPGFPLAGCAFPDYAWSTMTYALNGPYPELARHIAAAQASGLPGAFPDGVMPNSTRLRAEPARGLGPEPPGVPALPHPRQGPVLRLDRPGHRTSHAGLSRRPGLEPFHRRQAKGRKYVPNMRVLDSTRPGGREETAGQRQFSALQRALVAQRIEQLPSKYSSSGAVLTCGFAASRGANWCKLFAEPALPRPTAMALRIDRYRCPRQYGRQ